MAEDEDDSAAAWVKKSRQTQQTVIQSREERQKAEAEAARAQKPKDYSSRDVEGLVVRHDVGDIGDNPTILTLEDKGRGGV